jgi:hypothetical protein
VECVVNMGKLEKNSKFLLENLMGKNQVECGCTDG